MRLFLDSSIGLSIYDLIYTSHSLALLLSLSLSFLYPVSFSLVLLAITSALPAHSSTLFTYRDTDTVSLQHV